MRAPFLSLISLAASFWCNAPAEAQRFEADAMHLIQRVPQASFAPLEGLFVGARGYAAPSGREYAIVGLTDGIAFLELTAPNRPEVVAIFGATQPVLGLDAEFWREWAYVTGNYESGLDVFDLSQIDAGVVTRLSSSAGDRDVKVEIDEVTETLYRSGVGIGEAVEFFSLSDPSSPSYLGAYTGLLTMDLAVRSFASGPFSGRELAFELTRRLAPLDLRVLDVTDKTNVQELATIDLPFGNTPSDCELSADGSWLFVIHSSGEQLSGSSTVIYTIDVSDPLQPNISAVFTTPSPSLNYDLDLQGDQIFLANGDDGIRLIDASVPNQLVESAWFDTRPALQVGVLTGVISVDAPLPSGRCLAVDESLGLFVLGLGAPPVVVSLQADAPRTLDPNGTQLIATIVEAVPGMLAAGSALLVYDIGAGRVEVPLVPLGGGDYSVEFPPLPCLAEVEWSVRASSNDGLEWRAPRNEVRSAYVSVVAAGASELLSQDFESSGSWNAGAPGDNASTGRWQWGVPNGTIAAPYQDHSPVGVRCWVTGLGSPGELQGVSDVDGGRTSLTTPSYDLSDFSSVSASLWLWYTNQTGSTPYADALEILASADGGQTWVAAKTIGPGAEGNSPEWIEHVIRIEDFVPLTSEVQLRFVASDLAAPSLVEAAIDDFRLVANTCASPFGTPFCNPAEPNSTGQAGRLVALGSEVAQDNQLRLLAQDLPPNALGIYLASQVPGFLANPGGSQGNLCLGATVLRLNTGAWQSNGLGVAIASVDLFSMPPPFSGPVLGGQTWHFQGWHRDNDPLATSNFTSALTVTFQ